MALSKGQKDNPLNKRSRRQMTTTEKEKQQEKSKATKEKNKAAQLAKRRKDLVGALGAQKSAAVAVTMRGMTGGIAAVRATRTPTGRVGVDIPITAAAAAGWVAAAAGAGRSGDNTLLCCAAAGTNTPGENTMVYSTVIGIATRGTATGTETPGGRHHSLRNCDRHRGAY